MSWPGQSNGWWSAWCAAVFLATFLCIAPAAMLAATRPRWHFGAYWAYQLWGRLFFRLAGLRVEVEHRVPLTHKPCIFCPNHTSYLDIPMLVYALRQFFVFVGKSSLTKVPLFGFIFRRVHISVDRDNLRSRYAVLKKSLAALQAGKSIVIFPEGGFPDAPPNLGAFKEGPFRLAIEAQVPVVPVTLPFNWRLLPDQRPLRLRTGRAKVIFHAPISTTGLTVADLPALRESVSAVITQELRSQGVLPTLL
jgi:1-acyl-sn-glycerol-3-phosphate acyltransferase